MNSGSPETRIKLLGKDCNFVQSPTIYVGSKRAEQTHFCNEAPRLQILSIHFPFFSCLALLLASDDNYSSTTESPRYACVGRRYTCMGF